jgi:hypothetical protein
MEILCALPFKFEFFPSFLWWKQKRKPQSTSCKKTRINRFLRRSLCDFIRLGKQRLWRSSYVTPSCRVFPDKLASTTYWIPCSCGTMKRKNSSLSQKTFELILSVWIFLVSHRTLLISWEVIFIVQEGFVSLLQTPKIEDHPLSVFQDCLFADTSMSAG